MLQIKKLRFEIVRDMIIRDFSLDLQQGEVKTLFGPSGCGKTTLLRLVAGLNTPKSGTIHSQFKKIGFLFQDNRLLPHLTALQNIAIFNTQPNVDEIYTTAQKIGLEKSDLNKYPKELSGGMQKRAAFARAIACNPRYLFCDEPNSGLDPKTALLIDELVTDITHDLHITTIVNTHDLNSVITIGETISYIYEGHLQWRGNKDNVLSSDNELLNDFIYAQPLTQRIRQNL